MSSEEYELRLQNQPRLGSDSMTLPVFEHEEPEALALSSLSPRDRASFYFLILLYFVQGVPCGLAFGSIPFLLKERLSYSQIGLFSFATFPYSLKLLWSPIVDGFYFKQFGRRKSWIIPVQMFNCCVLFFLAARIHSLMSDAGPNLPEITLLFGVLVLGCATQDIAVDGWALTILSERALPYASTAQTIGINSGYFTSFTVFLSLSSPEFANKYFRSVPDSTQGLITLPQYLYWCGILFLVATAAVILGKHPDPRQQGNASDSVKEMYSQMVYVLRLPSIKSLVCVHLVAKVAFQAADAVTNLKFIEKGLSKEDLALVVLIDFPFEIIFGYYAAKWSTGARPLNPWLWGYVLRLGTAVLLMLLVMGFPKNGVGTMYLAMIIVIHVLANFFATVQSVSITAFHTRIADPEIGGTYMTVLNTLSNIGGQWPRAIVLSGVDWFTKSKCDSNKHCVTVRDGYYVMNMVCVCVGILIYLYFLKPTAMRLQSLPAKSWRKER